MRAAVYTFALSSVSQNDAVSWNASTKDADYRLVVSCDLGREVCLYLRDCGVMIFQATANPPRSDDLLNTALALLPADVDVCVRLDLDETPKNGWRSALDLVWHPNLSALSTLLHNADGRRYYIQNVHSRFAVRWSGRYEEVLSVGDGLTAKTDTIIIHRRPRPAPDLRVLREAAEECLNAHRIFIYAEALLQQGFLEDGLTELRKYQSMGGLPEESAYLWRLAAQVDEQSAHSLLVEAQRIYNSPSNFLALAEHHFRSQDWGQAYLCCQYALGILRNKPQPVLPRTEDPRLRGPFLHDLAATAAWNMWDFEAAYGHAVEADAQNQLMVTEAGKRLLPETPTFDYLDPARQQGGTFFWFGPADTLTPLHHDNHDIMFLQIYGRKQWMIFSPRQRHLLYNNIAVFSAVNPEQPDLSAYPLFRFASGTQFILYPGEALFLPVGWWHQVRALDVSISMSFINFLPNQQQQLAQAEDAW